MFLRLRPAEPTDFPFLYGLYVASREREFSPLPTDVKDQLATQQYTLYRKGLEATFPDARQFVVEVASQKGDHKPVGMVVLSEEPDVLWVVDMAISPENRSSGIGTALLKQLMDRCRESGAIMKGSVTPYNPARQLYARLGVTELKGQHGYIALEWHPE